MGRIVDLSVPIQASVSEATPVSVDVLDHAAGAAVLTQGRLTAADFPGGMAISNETVQLTTHTGTHMDAPLHYGPETLGRPARSIDEIPLEWCHAPGVRLDVRDVPVGKGITVAHLERALQRADHVLQDGEIVLLWTGASRLWGTQAYRTDFPGLTGAGTRWLVEQGVRVIGIDAWGMDRPTAVMVEDYENTGDQAYLWPAHMAGRTHEYVQLEKLNHLDQLPDATGFVVSCFPIPVMGAGAGWTRVVAHLPSP
ncbi:cyclase family protein [Flexivirga sp. ID2601S]|uniref:Cyclase family protein n=1 Tax=Flexivirga aerilata TaxID=1656889 RepID=A0A849AG04_9MICO|nr:cyclase family protein [Flexivirga aerilata]